MEVTVCIATHQNPEGLYLSTFSALAQLEKSSANWEILIAADGGCPDKWEQAHENISCLRLTGQNRTGSPQGTRDFGIRNAKYKNVLCIDSHVIISDIKKWVEEHERLHAATSFPAMIGGSSEMWRMYSSIFDWDGSFWYKHVIYQPKTWEPYRILETSHSGFMVDRDFYISSSGYTNLQQGYGGEETFWGLKAWMLGGQNWMIPQVSHAHYQPAGRNEGADAKPSYRRNFLIAAYVLGGQTYLEKAESYYKDKLQITPDIQRERVKICAGPFHGDLDALREYCKQEGIE
jgi:hypothetical protein